MSSLAYRDEPALAPKRSRDVTAALCNAGPDVLLGSALAVLTVIVLLAMSRDFNVDSWLALVTGREVWQSGIPYHETLTSMSQGSRWIDEQWLSQLLSYAVYRIGGLALLGTLSVALLVGPIAAAVITARRLGASLVAGMLILAVSLVAILPSSEVRTQEFGLPLFVAVVYLLMRDSRAPSPQVFWCLPILALWANLHGSATLGAMLVALRGVTVAWGTRRALARSGRAWMRPLGLLVGAPLAASITPYGLAIFGYYRTTMADSTLRRFVTEWQPVTSVPTTAAAVVVLAGIAVWSFRRHPSATTSWEKLALVVLIAASVSVVRNAVFLGLAALVILPASLASGRARPISAHDPRRAATNAVLALAALAAVLLATIVTLNRTDDSLQYPGQQGGLLTSVERITHANPSLRLFSDEHFADWLLWRDPQLAGRVASDVRFELLTGGELSALESVLDGTGPSWKSAARGFRLLVLSRGSDPLSVRRFLAEPGHRVLYDHDGQLVILRSRQEAERS